MELIEKTNIVTSNTSKLTSMNKFDTLIVTVPNAVLFPTGTHAEGFIPHAENDLRKIILENYT